MNTKAYFRELNDHINRMKKGGWMPADNDVMTGQGIRQAWKEKFTAFLIGLVAGMAIVIIITQI
jgi:hypothetical protein